MLPIRLGGEDLADMRTSGSIRSTSWWWSCCGSRNILHLDLYASFFISRNAMAKDNPWAQVGGAKVWKLWVAIESMPMVQLIFTMNQPLPRPRWYSFGHATGNLGMSKLRLAWRNPWGLENAEDPLKFRRTRGGFSLLGQDGCTGSSSS